MASGKPCAEIIREMPPAASAAGYDTRAGGSTPAETFPVLTFDAGTDEYMDYLCRLVDWAGGGLDLPLAGVFASATTGNARMQAAIRRLDAAEDVDGAHTYVYQSVNVAAPATNGQTAYATIAFTNAQIDSLANGEDFVLRLRRDADDGTNDTAAGDFQLTTLAIKEA
jgi:hypothetical protein